MTFRERNNVTFYIRFCRNDTLHRTWYVYGIHVQNEILYKNRIDDSTVLRTYVKVEEGEGRDQSTAVTFEKLTADERRSRRQNKIKNKIK